jgi:hypothetical protein
MKNAFIRLLAFSVFSAASLFCLAPSGALAEEAAADAQTTVTDFGWCVLTCPKTCKSGEEFEIKLELKNLQEVSRNWTADKLAVHLFWSGQDKWGGYLSHFGSLVVSKNGTQTLKGKFVLDDKLKDKAFYAHVNAYLNSDWGTENKAADLMGPRIQIVK